MKQCWQKWTKGQFLPKQVVKTNGVVPYQLHLLELKAILRNAQKYFSFLSEKQEGVTVAEKIVSLMTFRIPYYVGPLNTASKSMHGLCVAPDTKTSALLRGIFIK